jgi:CheY-like chemotaxis protein
MATGPHILVVEDDAATCRSMQRLLEGAGYPVACAANGLEALDHLRRSGPPLVILLDLAMPVMSGWQFRREQRRDPALAPIPVIVVSGEADLPRAAASLGAAHLPKPVEVDALLGAIRLLRESGPPALRVG